MSIFLSYIGVVSAIIGVGDILDKWIADNDGVREKLAGRLRKGLVSNPKVWLRSQSEFFCRVLSKLYASKHTRFEEAAWAGLLITPVLLVFIRAIYSVHGYPAPETGYLLLWAIVTALLIFAARALFLKTLAIVNEVWRKHIFVPGIIITVAWGGISIAFVYVLLLRLPESAGAQQLSAEMSTRFFLDNAPALALFLGFVGGFAMHFFSFPRIPISPIRAMISSLVFMLILGLWNKDASDSFFQELFAQGLAPIGFVAFNIFADAISLLETRWILRLGSEASVFGLAVLLMFDIFISALIFMALPLILGQGEAFLAGIVFSGSSPWLGILFWTTFSTSAVFYVFILASIASRPLYLLSKIARPVATVFVIERHPVRFLSFIMALVTTGIFGAWAAYAALS